MTKIIINPEACNDCGFFDCVCEVIKQHKPYCRFRIAATLSVGIECEHGYDVCPQCDPCTCEDASQPEGDKGD